MAGRDKKGVTSPELLMAVLIIGIAMLVAVILIDRTVSFKKTRDIVRFNDVQLILSSILLYEIDTAGKVPAGIDDDEDTWQLIGRRGFVCTNVCENKKVERDCVYLDELVGEYLDFIPQDLGFTRLGPSGYYINKRKVGNIITVGACTTEIKSTIEIKR